MTALHRELIALDIDGVISDIGRSISLELDRRDMLDVDYTDWLIKEDGCDDLCHQIMDNPYFWKNLKPFSDAWFQVNKWFHKGFDIHIITARRSEAARSCIKYWLDGWDIPNNAVHICNMGEKIDVASYLKPIFMVEDNPYEVERLIEGGVRTYLRKGWQNKDWWEKDYAVADFYHVEQIASQGLPF